MVIRKNVFDSETLHQPEAFVWEWLESGTVCVGTPLRMCNVCVLYADLCIVLYVCVCAFVAVCMVWLQRNHVEPILPIPLRDWVQPLQPGKVHKRVLCVFVCSVCVYMCVFCFSAWSGTTATLLSTMPTNTIIIKLKGNSSKWVAVNYLPVQPKRTIIEMWQCPSFS